MKLGIIRTEYDFWTFFNTEEVKLLLYVVVVYQLYPDCTQSLTEYTLINISVLFLPCTFCNLEEEGIINILTNILENTI